MFLLLDLLCSFFTEDTNCRVSALHTAPPVRFHTTSVSKMFQDEKKTWYTVNASETDCYNSRDLSGFTVYTRMHSNGWTRLLKRGRRLVVTVQVVDTEKVVSACIVLFQGPGTAV